MQGDGVRGAVLTCKRIPAHYRNWKDSLFMGSGAVPADGRRGGADGGQSAGRMADSRRGGGSGETGRTGRSVEQVTSNTGLKDISTTHRHRHAVCNLCLLLACRASTRGKDRIRQV